MSQQFNSYNESGGGKKMKIAERGFDPRTSGLWAQHASTAPLCFTCLWEVSLLLWVVRVLRCLCESAKVGTIGTQGTFKVKWWWLTVALESRWYMEDLKPLSTLPFNNNFYKTVIHVSSTIPMQQVTATLSALAFKQVWLISLCTKFPATLVTEESLIPRPNKTLLKRRLTLPTWAYRPEDPRIKTSLCSALLSFIYIFWTFRFFFFAFLYVNRVKIDQQWRFHPPSKFRDIYGTYSHHSTSNLCISVFYFSFPASDDQHFVAGVIHCLCLTDVFQDNIKL